VSRLFSPLHLGAVHLDNRIVISPMCEYSAEDGRATDWHRIHLGSMALSGAGLLLLEATAVEPRGRITYADLGLYDDATEDALGTILRSVRKYSPMPIGIQLSHAGRKASTERPWDGGAPILAGAPNGWQVVAPSALPYKEGQPVPAALSESEIAALVTAFVSSAQRAHRIGLDAIEIHAAHGYLLHQFLSPLSNHRTDSYGGSLENRMRLTLQLFEAVRSAVPRSMAVGIRVSATDWVDGGWDLDQTITLAKRLDAMGCDFIDVTSGGLSLAQKIPIGPGYHVPFAEAIKPVVQMPVISVGMITDAHQAEQIIATGRADAVALARGMLYDPRWPWHAAAALGATAFAPPQYLRCEPADKKSLFRRT